MRGWGGVSSLRWRDIDWAGVHTTHGVIDTRGVLFRKICRNGHKNTFLGSTAANSGTNGAIRRLINIINIGWDIGPRLGSEFSVQVVKVVSTNHSN